MECYFNFKNYESKRVKGDKKIFINNYDDYKKLLEYDFTIKELKDIIKRFNLPKCKSTKKNDIKLFCINIMYLSTKIIKIQRCFNNYFIKMFNKTLGPCYRNFSLSNNVDDFLTTEGIDEIDYYYFFSFKDKDNFIYSFNIVSFANLLYKQNQPKNPYNRMDISKDIIDTFEKRIRYNKILKKIEIFNEYKEKEPSVNDRIQNLFHKIDLLGNYSDHKWFIDLNANQKYRFIYELIEIWTYRAQLSREIKMNICPPTGNPFICIPSGFMNNHNNIRNYTDAMLTNWCLKIMEKLVYSAILDSNKSLGALYILSALTLVSENARNSLPWLYASVYYN